MKKGNDSIESIKERAGTGVILIALLVLFIVPTILQQPKTIPEPLPHRVAITPTPKVEMIKVVKQEPVRAEIPRERPTPQPETVKQYAERRCNEVYGMGHFSALDHIITNESGWRPTAQNPHSSAWGLFQFLNQTWKGTGIAKTSDPKQQVEAGLIYIKNRYQNPSNAWSWWLKHNWY